MIERLDSFGHPQKCGYLVYYRDYYAEVAKLSGWLKYLVKTYDINGEWPPVEKEISDYIKASEIPIPLVSSHERGELEVENINKVTELKYQVKQLEQLEAEWNGHAAGEKLSGNVVKEAHYKGTATGVRIAINVLNERIDQVS